MQKPRIAILFPAFLGGGAEMVCLWMVEVLRTDYEVTLVTFSHFRFGNLNAYYGTQVPDGQVKILHPFASATLNRIVAGSRRMFTLRQHLLIRFFKREMKRYDLCVSAFNEMDLGVRGIQYIHFPLFGRGHEAARSEVGAPDSGMRATYRNICRALSGFSDERMKENLSIANSHWTAEVVRRVYGIDARVIYPPVSGGFPAVPWDRKRSGIIVVGRLVPEKRVERAIDIAAQMRNGGHDVPLCIAGKSGDPRYLRRLRKRIRGKESWIEIRTDLTRKQLCALVAHYRYGLHVRENEQFGIGVAEMLKAGCIPFVAAGGGQTEIIDGYDQLIFDSEQQAVEKMARVMSCTQTQKRILETLQKRAQAFSPERFMAEIRKAVKDFLAA